MYITRIVLAFNKNSLQAIKWWIQKNHSQNEVPYVYDYCIANSDIAEI